MACQQRIFLGSPIHEYVIYPRLNTFYNTSVIALLSKIFAASVFCNGHSKALVCLKLLAIVISWLGKADVPFFVAFSGCKKVSLPVDILVVGLDFWLNAYNSGYFLHGNEGILKCPPTLDQMLCSFCVQTLAFFNRAND